MNIKHIKSGLIWGLGILLVGVCCFSGTRSEAKMLPAGPIGMVKKISFDQNYLVMDGVTYYFDDAIQAVIKEKFITANIRVKIVFTEKDGRNVIISIMREDEINPPFKGPA